MEQDSCLETKGGLQHNNPSLLHGYRHHAPDVVQLDFFRFFGHHLQPLLPNFHLGFSKYFWPSLVPCTALAQQFPWLISRPFARFCLNLAFHFCFACSSISPCTSSFCQISSFSASFKHCAQVPGLIIKHGMWTLLQWLLSDSVWPVDMRVLLVVLVSCKWIDKSIIFISVHLSPHVICKRSKTVLASPDVVGWDSGPLWLHPNTSKVSCGQEVNVGFVVWLHNFFGTDRFLVHTSKIEFHLTRVCFAKLFSFFAEVIYCFYENCDWYPDYSTGWSTLHFADAIQL